MSDAAKKNDPLEEESTPEPAPKAKQKKSKKAKPAGDKKKKKPVTHPRTLDMITEALEVLKDVKGSSVYAVKAYVLSTYKTVRPDMLNHMLKQGFTQGLSTGDLVRPKGQNDTTVLNGRYKLGGKKVAPPRRRDTPKRGQPVKKKKGSGKKRPAKKASPKATPPKATPKKAAPKKPVKKTAKKGKKK